MGLQARLMSRAAALICWNIVFAWGLPASAEDDGFSVETRTPSFEDSRVPSGFVARLDVSDAFSQGRDLADVLSRVPGLWVRRQSSLGQPAFVRVRGGNARQVAVSIDGQRLNVPYGPGFDVGTLSLGGLESVDVYRGSAGVNRGSGALTGALNLTTSMRAEPGWNSHATTMMGSFQTYGLSADAQVAGDEFGAKVSVMGRRSEGDFPFVDAQGTALTRENNDHERYGSMLSFDWHPSSRNDVRASASVEGGERGSPGPSEFQEVFSGARIDDLRAFSMIRARQREAAAGKHLSVDFEETAGVQYRDQRYTNPRTLLGGVGLTSTSEYLGVNGGFGAVLFSSLGTVTHLDAGLRHEIYEGEQAGALVDVISASRSTLGVSASNELLFWGERVSVLAGLRGELVTNAPDVLLPSGGAVLRPFEWLHIRSNIARTFRVADFDELYLDIETVRGNPDLAPERALTWDAGILVGPEEARLEVAYFENHIDSLILFLPISSYVLEATNLRGALSRGVESTATIRPAKFLALQAGYTFTDASLDTSPGTQLPQQPRHVTNARAELELGRWVPLESLRLIADVQGRSEVNLDNFGNLTNAGYVTADFGVSARPVSWLGLSVTAQNLLDEQTVVDSLQQPLPGRAFYASLSIDGGSP